MRRSTALLAMVRAVSLRVVVPDANQDEQARTCLADDLFH